MIGLSALRLRLPHPVRWLVAVCFAAAVIVGLMGMHTISSGHTARRWAGPAAGLVAEWSSPRVTVSSTSYSA